MEVSACFFSSMNNRNLYFIIIIFTVFSFQVLEIYKLWPTKKTALQNYKRQASVVSQKPSVELKLTYKTLGKDENIRREGDQESRTKIPLTNQEKPNSIYPSLK